MKELNLIQTRLVAPKGNTNSFGGYKYRSLENIMEAVKPLLRETGCTITFTDDLVVLADRLFCKSTAILKNDKGEVETSTSFAEMDTHKGMSKEQSSGSSSSYARKYAVSSLLAIDDNQDPDSLEPQETKPAAKPAPRRVAPAKAVVSVATEKKSLTRDEFLKGSYDSLVDWLKKQPSFDKAVAKMRDTYNFEDGVDTAIISAATNA